MPDRHNSKSTASIMAAANKSYKFMPPPHPGLPADYWSFKTPLGPGLFLVLYTLGCRYGKCTACNLPSKVSQYHVPFDRICQQIKYMFEFRLSPKEREELTQIVLSNNGSVLDQETFSSNALMYFFIKVNSYCPNVRLVTMESRPEYVEVNELAFIARGLEEGDTKTELEIAIGFEAFDNNIRNKVFKKGLTLRAFEDMVKKLAQFNFRLRTYFMLKPVSGMSEEEAIADIIAGVDYIDQIARDEDIRITVHLNPTYVGEGTPLAEDFFAGKYEPPQLTSVVPIIEHCRGKLLSLYIGLNDEELSIEGGSPLRPGDEDLLEVLREFNETGNYGLVPKMKNAAKAIEAAREKKK